MDHMNMNAILAKLDVNKLIKNIQQDVERMVSSHLEEKFMLIASEIATQCNQDESKVMTWIQTAVNMEKPVVTKKKVPKPETQVVPCTAKTKAGTPCKYKCVEGETLCKKHKKIQEQPQEVSTSHLPADEQQWLNAEQDWSDQQEAYKKTFFPKYEKSEIEMDEDVVDDTEEDHTDHMLVTHE